LPNRLKHSTKKTTEDFKNETHLRWTGTKNDLMTERERETKKDRRKDIEKR